MKFDVLDFGPANLANYAPTYMTQHLPANAPAEHVLLRPSEPGSSLGGAWSHAVSYKCNNPSARVPVELRRTRAQMRAHLANASFPACFSLELV